MTEHLSYRSGLEPAVASSTHDVQASRDFAIETARLLADSHCEDVVIFDVRGLSDLANYIIIASGTSDRQIKSLAGHVNELAREHGFVRYGSDRDAASTWLALDYVDLMVHLFEPATRAHYDMEMLWGDAPRVSWHRG
ncbi:ribosome silencing factor [Phycisphaerales bacterium AB-hyl4]|uniref:Ribosomal silencing factor RsfS n=1 Tax=Natronomicrosphaera hydrolytica TaxID=3242702 RepID=A0ABV4U2Y7_9BACT